MPSYALTRLSRAIGNVLPGFERLTAAARLAAAHIRVRRVLKVYRANRPRDAYEFSDEDRRLYLQERACRLPGSTLIEHEAGFARHRIGQADVVLPESAPAVHLPWLYHEIFDPFCDNPSSYAHPAIMQSLETVDWVLDGGAAEGFFACFIADRFRGRYLAVEPAPLMAEALERSLTGILRAPAHPLVIRAALGRTGGSGAFTPDSDGTFETRIRPTPADAAKGEQAVEITTIDDLAREHGLRGSGLIKLDIEGAEMDALRGAEHIIAQNKPRLALAVYHGYSNARECADLIRRFRDDYTIAWRGLYAYLLPPRPYMLFAW